MMEMTQWRRSLRAGIWVDVKNSEGNWCLAYITELKSNYLNIQYDASNASGVILY